MYKIKIQLGDPSRDGHNMSEDRVINSNKPVLDWEKAYKVAKKKSGIELECVCQDYEDSCLDPEVWAKLKELGWTSSWSEKRIKKFEDDGYEKLRMNLDLMTDLILWYLKLGDPELELSETSIKEIPIFSKSFGYGLYDF